MTSEQYKFLDELPLKALSNVIDDYASDDIAMSMSTFLLGMHPMMRTLEPLELFDWCVMKIRKRLEQRLKDRTETKC